MLSKVFVSECVPASRRTHKAVAPRVSLGPYKVLGMSDMYAPMMQSMLGQSRPCKNRGLCPRRMWPIVPLGTRGTREPLKRKKRCKEKCDVRNARIPPFQKHGWGKRLQWVCVETVSGEFPNMKKHPFFVQESFNKCNRSARSGNLQAPGPL